MYPIKSEPRSTTDMAVLLSLSTDELKVLVNDEEKFLSLMKDQVQEDNKADTEKQLMLASTRSLAEFNLNREKELMEGKRKLEESTLEGEQIIQSIKEKVALIKEKSGEKNPETMLALLQTAAAEQEEASEDIASKFLDGELDVESFLEQFQSCRRLMHMRRVKADKMSDILNKPIERPASPQFSPSFNCHYQSPHQPPKPLPYPTGTFNMPTPLVPPRY